MRASVKLPLPLRRLLAGWLARPLAKQAGGTRLALGLVKVDRLGDFVLATGVLRELLRYQGAENSCLFVSEGTAELAALCFPDLRQIQLPNNPTGALRDLLPLRRRLQRELGQLHFETLICLRHSRHLYRDCLLRWPIADKRLAYETTDANWRPSPGNLPQLACISKPPGPPWNKDLLAHRLVSKRHLPFEPSWEQLQPWLPKPATAAGDGAEIVLCPHGSAPLRDLPLALLPSLARHLEASGRPVLLVGTSDKAEALAGIQQALRRAGLLRSELKTGLSFAAFYGLVSRAGLVISTETATAHLAAALDRPLLCLVGGGHRGYFAPWGRSPRQLWLEAPQSCDGCGWNCHQSSVKCLTALGAARVEQALSSLLKEL